MPKMIQIHNVPDELYRNLKARAASEGVSLSDFLLGEIRRSVQRPTVREIRDRLRSRDPVQLDVPTADAVRQERGSF